MIGEMGIVSRDFFVASGSNSIATLRPEFKCVGKFLGQIEINTLGAAVIPHSLLMRVIRANDSTSDVEIFRSRHVNRQFWAHRIWYQDLSTGVYRYAGGGGTPIAGTYYCDAFGPPENYTVTSASPLPNPPARTTVPSERYAPITDANPVNISVTIPDHIYFLADLTDEAEYIKIIVSAYRDDPFLGGSTPFLDDTIPTTSDASTSEVQVAVNLGATGANAYAWMIRI